MFYFSVKSPATISSAVMNNFLSVLPGLVLSSKSSQSHMICKTVFGGLNIDLKQDRINGHISFIGCLS